MAFVKFPKIPRWSRRIIITEKIDGTNAQIEIPEDPSAPVLFGSRERYITPGKQTDNYGFASWATQNLDLLRRLGPGHHYGEWWGAGIQRRYGRVNSERYFSLFNTGRWNPGSFAERGLDQVPGLSIVPVLYDGPMSEEAIEQVLAELRLMGSRAMPGFMDPEGIVIYHTASGSLYKRFCDPAEDAAESKTALVNTLASKPDPDQFVDPLFSRLSVA
jgi:hypothetical protein